MSRTPNFVNPVNPNPTMENHHMEWVRDKGEEFELPISLFLKKLIGGIIVFSEEKPNVLKALLNRCPEDDWSKRKKDSSKKVTKKTSVKEEPKAKKGRPPGPRKKSTPSPAPKKVLKSTKSSKPATKKGTSIPTKKRKSLHR